MLNNDCLFQLTQLAEVSYANFWDSVAKKPVTDEGVIRRRLTLKDIGEEQANDLLYNWAVVSHQQNTSSGFSATLFQSKDGTNKYVLSIRGTEPKSLFLDWATDAGDIVRDGLALDQIVDMYSHRPPA